MAEQAAEKLSGSPFIRRLRGAIDGYSERVDRSAANKTWYLGSSRTDFVNRGSCISLLMRATLASAVLLGCLLFFLIQPC
jgi:hypothetical protein